MNKPTKLCSHCQTDIPLKAKKCPNCQTDLRSWIVRNPFKTVLLIFIGIPILMVMFLTGDSTSAPVAVVPVSSTSIQNFETDLQGWAEGRWSDVLVGQDSGEVIAKIYTLGGANEVALNGYCKILKESAQKHINSSTRKNLFIYQNGEVAKACI
jgi:hypothetical protein